MEESDDLFAKWNQNAFLHVKETMLFPKFPDPLFRTKTILRHPLPEGSHKAGASKGLGTGEGASVCDVCSLRAPPGHQGRSHPPLAAG